MDQLNLADIRGILRRRWLLLVTPLVIGAVIGVLVAFALPPLYRSTARILVESQQIPEDLARSTVTGGATERVTLIRQRLMARDNLLDIGRRFSIFEKQDEMSPTQLAEALRQSTEITNVVLAMQGRDTVTASAIDISFEAGSPDVAARIANEFVTQTLELNIRDRTERARNTLEFFDRQVEQLGGEIGTLQDRIAAYKQENELSLPESVAARRDELRALGDRRFERERQRIALQENKRQLERALELGRAPVETALTPSERQLEALRGQLAEQRAVYADSHPSVRALLARIEALETAVQPAGATEGQGAAQDSVAARQQETRLQIGLIEDQLRLLETQNEIETNRARRLEAALVRAPEVERELSGLEQRLANLQVQYQQAVLKRAAADTGEALEVNRQAERFEVINQAQPPAAPISPNRPIIAAAGLGIGGVVGLGLVVLVELLTRCIRTSADMVRQLDLAPVVVVPYISTPGETTRRRWMRRVLLLGMLVAIPLLLFIVDQSVMPLVEIGDRILQRSGLGAIL